MNQESSSAGGKKRGRGYTEEFKRSVVDHWCHTDKTAEQVAREFGVKVWNVRDWRRKYGPTHKPVDAPMPEKPEELKRELHQLRKDGGEAPSESSIKRVFMRAGLVEQRRVRSRERSGRLHSGRRATTPNKVWTVDFKGWWYGKAAGANR